MKSYFLIQYPIKWGSTDILLLNKSKFMKKIDLLPYGFHCYWILHYNRFSMYTNNYGYLMLTNQNGYMMCLTAVFVYLLCLLPANNTGNTISKGANIGKRADMRGFIHVEISPNLHPPIRYRLIIKCYKLLRV